MAKEPLLQSFGALPWGRWLGEFVIIVVGVLVALAVDSYREDQIDEAWFSTPEAPDRHRGTSC